MSSDGLPPPRAPVSHPLLHPGTAPKPSHEPDASDSNYLLATRIPDRGASRGALAKTVEVVGQTVEDGPRTDSRGGKESPISIQIDRGEDEKDGEKSDRMDESSEKSPDVSIAASSPLHLNSANSHPVSSPSHLSPNYHSATSPNQLSAKPSLTIRRVPLSERGNLQLEIPVPTSILSRPGTALLDAPEVTLTRYTAVTDNPSDFATAGYSLRPPAFNRTTELSVALTLYNEDPLLFARSMSALSQNLAMLSQKWGPHAWEKFIVVIVADGRAQIHPGTLNALSVLGVFQEGVMKSHVGGREVQAHVFEYTTQVELYEEKGVVKTKVGGPMQVIFCLKVMRMGQLVDYLILTLRWMLWFAVLDVCLLPTDRPAGDHPPPLPFHSAASNFLPLSPPNLPHHSLTQSRKKTPKKSTRTAGSSPPSRPSSTPESASSSTPGPDLLPRLCGICGDVSIGIRMWEGRAARLWQISREAGG